MGLEDWGSLILRIALGAVFLHGAWFSGSQAIFVSFLCTSPFEQSPYILSKKAVLRSRPGSSCNPGGFSSGPRT
jgi:hypothetical protein